MYVGTFNIVYTVKDLTNRGIQSLTDVGQKLKHQFDQLMSMQKYIHYYFVHRLTSRILISKEIKPFQIDQKPIKLVHLD